MKQYHGSLALEQTSPQGAPSPPGMGRRKFTAFSTLDLDEVDRFFDDVFPEAAPTRAEPPRDEPAREDRPSAALSPQELVAHIQAAAPPPASDPLGARITVRAPPPPDELEPVTLRQPHRMRRAPHKHVVMRKRLPPLPPLPPPVPPPPRQGAKPPPLPPPETQGAKAPLPSIPPLVTLPSAGNDVAVTRPDLRRMAHLLAAELNLAAAGPVGASAADAAPAGPDGDASAADTAPREEEVEPPEPSTTQVRCKVGTDALNPPAAAPSGAAPLHAGAAARRIGGDPALLAPPVAPPRPRPRVMAVKGPAPEDAAAREAVPALPRPAPVPVLPVPPPPAAERTPERRAAAPPRAAAPAVPHRAAAGRTAAASPRTRRYLWVFAAMAAGIATVTAAAIHLSWTEPCEIAPPGAPLAPPIERALVSAPAPASPPPSAPAHAGSEARPAVRDVAVAQDVSSAASASSASRGPGEGAPPAPIVLRGKLPERPAPATAPSAAPPSTPSAAPAAPPPTRSVASSGRIFGDDDGR